MPLSNTGKVAIFLTILVVLAAAVVGIYFGTKKKQSSISDEPNTSKETSVPAGTSTNDIGTSSFTGTTGVASNVPIETDSGGNITEITGQAGPTGSIETGVTPPASNSNIPKSNLTCLLNIAAYQNGTNTFGSTFNADSLSNSTNQANLAKFCKAGISIYSDGCNLTLANPQNNASFRKYCCNDSVDISQCNARAANCIIDKANFANQAYGFTNYNDSALSSPDSVNSLASFCQLGSDIMSNKCSIDSNYPANNSVFRKYCCNGSTDLSACQSNTACLTDTGYFLNKDYSYQNLSASSIGTNINEVTNYCSAGINMQKNGCTSITRPMNSSTFRNLCCNGSNDINACNAASLKCASDLSTFKNQSYNLQGIVTNPNSVASNIDRIIAFCDLGASLTTACGKVEPHNDSTYQALCT